MYLPTQLPAPAAATPVRSFVFTVDEVSRIAHTTPDPDDPSPPPNEPIPDEVPQPDPPPVQDPIPHQVPIKA